MIKRKYIEASREHLTVEDLLLLDKIFVDIEAPDGFSVIRDYDRTLCDVRYVLILWDTCAALTRYSEGFRKLLKYASHCDDVGILFINGDVGYCPVPEE